MAPKVSIITPTFDRDRLLAQAYRRVAAQDLAVAEWIVVDDSAEPSRAMAEIDDPRVTYIHLPQRCSTGEKRNIAIAASSGEVIVQFDDDDYYAPTYVSTMVRVMAEHGADFVKLSSFFVYNALTRQLAYWDLTDRSQAHYLWAPDAPVSLVRLTDNAETQDMHLGYGFSYVFRRAVWRANRFADLYWNQDTPFARAALAAGFKIALLSDSAGLCAHIIHGRNASRAFPQHIVPPQLASRFFPDVAALFPLGGGG